MCVKYHVRKITHVYTWRDTVAAVQKPRHQKTATQLWVADNRKRLGETPADLARLTGVTTDTARGWESRGSPGEDALLVLERHFGVPRPTERSGDGSTTAGLSALIERLDKQAAAIDRLAASVERLAQGQLSPEELISLVRTMLGSAATGEVDAGTPRA